MYLRLMGRDSPQVTVKRVAHNGVPDMGEVNANLVRPPAEQAAFDQRIFPVKREGHDRGDGGFSALSHPTANTVFLPQNGRGNSDGRLYFPLCQRRIDLFDRSGVHFTRRQGRFRQKHQPRRIFSRRVMTWNFSFG